MTPRPGTDTFQELYSGFEMPLCDLDCGLKCGPHNYHGVPVCCDINLVIPAAFEGEWVYLQHNTDLWQPWSSSELYSQELEEQVQDGQVLLQCQGYQNCQRSFRTLTCRAFPFYPYLTSRDKFSGLGYYVDFRPSCWIISNLSVVTNEYKAAFQKTFSKVFEIFPDSRKKFLDYSRFFRQEAARKNEAVVLMDFRGSVNLVDPISEGITPTKYEDLQAFGPFSVTRELRFPDEINHEKDQAGS